MRTLTKIAAVVALFLIVGGLGEIARALFAIARAIATGEYAYDQ